MDAGADSLSEPADNRIPDSSSCTQLKQEKDRAPGAELGPNSADFACLLSLLL
jgi:hypothetical protein